MLRMMLSSGRSPMAREDLCLPTHPRVNGQETSAMPQLTHVPVYRSLPRERRQEPPW